MDKDLLNFINQLPLQKERLLNVLKENVEKHGLRPTARTIELNHGTLHQIINGKPVSIETLASYVQRLMGG